MSGGSTAVPQSTRFMVQWEEHPMHLATRLGYLLEHQSLVDVTLMCNTHTLKVHRSVLAACSPYFESVLQRQLGNHPLIVLKDMKFCVLKSLIEFMYCGETSVTEENLNPLMEAARFFQVKGLCTMSKEVLGGERPSPSKPVTATVNGSNISPMNLITATNYRGRGRRPGTVGRGRRNLSALLGQTPPAGAPQSETAQIMLSLSGNPNGQTMHSTSHNLHISPNSRITRPIQPALPIHNGVLSTTDLKALRDQLNLEPRRRGRRRQNYGVGRGRIKDEADIRFAPQTIKKEPGDMQQNGGLILNPVESNVSINNSNGSNNPKSPMLANLLNKAEIIAKDNIKTENGAQCQSGEQESVVYRFDGKASGASKYLDALKEAGVPTDVPVLVDNGDGNYVTLTEDVLMKVLGNNEDVQFHLTEATLQQGDISEGVVLQDGTIMMTGKQGKSDVGGNLITVGKRAVSMKGVRETKSRRQPKQKSITKDTPCRSGEKNTPPRKNVKKEPTAKSTDVISDEVLESLKNGAATEAEADPDAVVLFEVTDNQKVCKYVVSSKEISALKALNEQIGKQKNQNSPVDKKEPVPTTVIEGNTNIAEITLNFLKNSRKSIVSEVLARAHSLENQVKNGTSINSPKNNCVKNETATPYSLDVNVQSELVNDTSVISGITQLEENVQNPNKLQISQEFISGENNVAVHSGNQFMHISDGQHEGIALSSSDDLVVLKHKDEDLGQLHDDGSEMRFDEGSQADTETTQEGIEDINEEDLNDSGKGFSMLENESQLVELQFIDGNGERIERYRLEGTVLSEKDLSELTGMSDHSKNSNVLGLLNMVCEEAASAANMGNEVHNELIHINHNVPCTSALSNNVSADNSVSQSFYSEVALNNSTMASSSEMIVVESVKNEVAHNFDASEMFLEENDCQELSKEKSATDIDLLASEEAMGTSQVENESTALDERCQELPVKNTESIKLLDSGHMILGEPGKGKESDNYESREIYLEESNLQELSSPRTATAVNHLSLEEQMDSSQFDVGPDTISLGERICQETSDIKDEPNQALLQKSDLILFPQSIINSEIRISNDDLGPNDRECSDLSMEQTSKLQNLVEENKKVEGHCTDLESNMMVLQEGTVHALPAQTSISEQFVINDADEHSEMKPLDSDEITMREEMSVEQALQAMMGDTSEHEQDFNQDVKKVDNVEHCLHHQAEISVNVSESNTIQYLYVDEENVPLSDSKSIPSEIQTHLVLRTDPESDGMQAVIEAADATVISPTKDVPFAVGLLPVKDALEQMQAVSDFQPRQTRARCVDKQEAIGSKRRASTENLATDCKKKSKKSDGDEKLTDGLVDNIPVQNDT